MRRREIVVGIVRDQTRIRILVCRRRTDQSHPGKWEFPGGKLEPHETPLQALRRELLEEVDIHIQAAHQLVTIDHDYPEASIRLHAWVIDRWTGKAQHREDQEFSWVSLAELGQLTMPAANRRIIKAIPLAPLYLITPDRSVYDQGFLDTTEQLLAGGVRLLQFRSTQSTFERHRDLVGNLIEICNRHGSRLIYNGSVEQALGLGAHGVHLNSMRLMKPVPVRLADDWLVSASCHDAAQIRQASLLDLDFCVLGPVHQSRSHPGREGLGWQQFAQIAAGARIPVYALGGIMPEELGTARTNGAHGIAMISGVWDAADPVAASRLAD